MRHYVSRTDMGDHLIEESPQETELNKKTKKKWLMEDHKVFNQIQNTLDLLLEHVTNHCDTVEELWDYLEFMYTSKQDLSHVQDLLLKIYRANI